MKNFLLIFIIAIITGKLLLPLVALNYFYEEPQGISSNHTLLVQELLKHAQKERENEKKLPLSQLLSKDVPSKLSEPFLLKPPAIIISDVLVICHRDNVKLFQLSFSVFNPPELI